MKKSTLLLTSLLVGTTALQAADVGVFLDNGSATGSTNTAQPFTAGDRDASWDVLATAESGLSDFGAAVMTVRMVAVNINGDSRTANTGGGSGLGITTGGTDTWVSNAQAALFQFSFYSDAGKTNEITGLTITLDSVIARMTDNATNLINARAGSGALTNDGGTGNALRWSLGGNELGAGNDNTNSSTSDLGLLPSSTSGATPAFYTIASSGVTGSEDSSFWLRRTNSAGGSDSAYQIGGLNFTVIPEPGTFALIGGLFALAFVAVRRRR